MKKAKLKMTIKDRISYGFLMTLMAIGSIVLCIILTVKCRKIWEQYILEHETEDRAEEIFNGQTRFLKYVLEGEHLKNISVWYWDKKFN